MEHWMEGFLSHGQNDRLAPPLDYSFLYLEYKWICHKGVWEDDQEARENIQAQICLCTDLLTLPWKISKQ